MAESKRDELRATDAKSIIPVPGWSFMVSETGSIPGDKTAEWPNDEPIPIAYLNWTKKIPVKGENGKPIPIPLSYQNMMKPKVVNNRARRIDEDDGDDEDHSDKDFHSKVKPKSIKVTSMENEKKSDGKAGSSNDETVVSGKRKSGATEQSSAAAKRRKTETGKLASWYTYTDDTTIEETKRMREEDERKRKADKSTAVKLLDSASKAEKSTAVKVLDSAAVTSDRSDDTSSGKKSGNVSGSENGDNSAVTKDRSDHNPKSTRGSRSGSKNVTFASDRSEKNSEKEGDSLPVSISKHAIVCLEKVDAAEKVAKPTSSSNNPGESQTKTEKEKTKAEKKDYSQISSDVSEGESETDEEHNEEICNYISEYGQLRGKISVKIKKTKNTRRKRKRILRREPSPLPETPRNVQSVKLVGGTEEEPIIKIVDVTVYDDSARAEVYPEIVKPRLSTDEVKNVDSLKRALEQGLENADKDVKDADTSKKGYENVLKGMKKSLSEVTAMKSELTTCVAEMEKLTKG
jgi:hypothetical protein